MSYIPIDFAIYLESYLERVRAKVERGAVDHGDRSFDLRSDSLVEELRDECADISGWGAILDRRLQVLAQACEQLEGLLELRDVATAALQDFRRLAESAGAPAGPAALEVVARVRAQLLRLGADVAPGAAQVW